MEFCEPTQSSRTGTCLEHAALMGGATVLHPYNDLDVIAGQASIGVELMEQVCHVAARRSRPAAGGYGACGRVPPARP